MKKWGLIAILALGGLSAARAAESAGADAADDSFVSLTRTSERQSNLPTNISVLTEDQIRQSGAKTLDQIIDLLPGVEVVKEGTIGTFSTVRLRGAPSSAQVQIVVDDQPLGGVSTQFLDLSQISLQNVRRIEVVRGGSSVLYGANTIGGVIHLITRKQTEAPTAEAGFEGGTFRTHTYTARAGAAGERLSGFATFRRYVTDGFQQNSDAHDNTGTASGAYSFGNGVSLSAQVARAVHEVGDPQGTSIPVGEWDGNKERTPANPTARTKQDANDGRFVVGFPVGGQATVRSSFYGSRQHYRTFASEGVLPSFDQVNRIAGNDSRLTTVNGLTVGASYEHDGQSTADSETNHVADWGSYLEKIWRAAQWTFIPAVRYDHHSTFGGVTNPRFTAVYHATSWWSVSANAARSFRAPSFLELFFKSSAFNGNPELKPEAAWTYDFGNEFRITESQSLKLTGYYTRIKDRIAAGLSTYENLDRVETEGAEAEWSGHAGPFTHDLNYTYERAIGTSFGSSRYVPLRLTPRHMANGLVTWDHRGWAVTTSLRYVARQFRLDDSGGEVLPAYAVWNARLGKTVSIAELYVGVNNIANRHYAQNFDLDPNFFTTTFDPQPGRTYYAGATVRFAGAPRS